MFSISVTSRDIFVPLDSVSGCDTSFISSGWPLIEVFHELAVQGGTSPVESQAMCFLGLAPD